MASPRWCVCISLAVIPVRTAPPLSVSTESQNAPHGTQYNPVPSNPRAGSEDPSRQVPARILAHNALSGISHSTAAQIPGDGWRGGFGWLVEYIYSNPNQTKPKKKKRHLLTLVIKIRLNIHVDAVGLAGVGIER